MRWEGQHFEICMLCDALGTLIHRIGDYFPKFYATKAKIQTILVVKDDLGDDALCSPEGCNLTDSFVFAEIVEPVEPVEIVEIVEIGVAWQFFDIASSTSNGLHFQRNLWKR
jgi:hypothetical protein